MSKPKHPFNKRRAPITFKQLNSVYIRKLRPESLNRGNYKPTKYTFCFSITFAPTCSTVFSFITTCAIYFIPFYFSRRSGTHQCRYQYQLKVEFVSLRRSYFYIICFFLPFGLNISDKTKGTRLEGSTLIACNKSTI